MQRILLLTVALTLILSVSGASSVIFPEPCSPEEQADDAGPDCSPTCPTCGCCAQAGEPAPFALPDVVDRSTDWSPEAVSVIPDITVRGVLHVPKTIA